MRGGERSDAIILILNYFFENIKNARQRAFSFWLCKSRRNVLNLF